MKSHKELKFLREDTLDNTEYGKDFSDDTKSAIFIRDQIDKSPICGLCHARIYFKSINIDHIQRKQDGGVGVLDNGQMTHPFCNTGYKEYLHSKGIDL